MGRTPPEINGVRYTWHHMDDFRINEEGKMVCTMQLVRADAHTNLKGMSHTGSVGQMKAYTGNKNLYPF
ncbi:HNH endonuclease [Flammeovirga kamogawensis]|uniref:HNH endonuclease n=1 Tax=Flammeovirga kamogawensis TaxID=373891 RepID=A0ABX8H426_9BACT|nr:HNH endonuclease [Flammeovirga kamogawensis]MBB6460276.1 hypothetical protein [Flammeovirga kamogawensis]QWG10087.1 HNH endonuclease [Flammeovirga kamogawensis]TRX65594.1 hypothetical protein EO216_24040 [Flammeovirga kamogawensis]